MTSSPSAAPETAQRHDQTAAGPAADTFADPSAQPRQYEREFVLMPLFRRLREAFFGTKYEGEYEYVEAAEQYTAEQPAPLPADTTIYYPEQLRATEPAAEQAPRIEPVLAQLAYAPDQEQQQVQLAYAPHHEQQQQERVAATAQDEVFALHEQIAPAAPADPAVLVESASTNVPSAEVMDELVAEAQAVAAMEDIGDSPQADSPSMWFSRERRRGAPTLVHSREGEAWSAPEELPAMTELPEEHPLTAAASASEPYGSHREVISQTAAYDIADDPATTAAKAPAAGRQVTFTLPPFKMPTLDWRAIAPAMAYAALGFGVCLMLFLIPVLRRPASSILPNAMQQPAAATPASGLGFTVNGSAAGAAAAPTSGYTVNGGGYTVGGPASQPAAAAAQPAVQANPAKPAPGSRKPLRAAAKQHRPARRSADDAQAEDVVVHHFSTAQPHMLRANSDVKKYSDND